MIENRKPIIFEFTRGELLVAIITAGLLLWCAYEIFQFQIMIASSAIYFQVCAYS